MHDTVNYTFTLVRNNQEIPNDTIHLQHGWVSSREAGVIAVEVVRCSVSLTSYYGCHYLFSLDRLCNVVHRGNITMLSCCVSNTSHKIKRYQPQSSLREVQFTRILNHGIVARHKNGGHKNNYCPPRFLTRCSSATRQGRRIGRHREY